MTARNGGPAFPRPISRDEFSGDRPQTIPDQEGMTLRDYFAGIALPIVMENDEWILGRNLKAKVITDADMAKAAYQVADAMLKERAR